PVRWPNVYGIDMPTREELIAHGRSIEEIRRYIGADALIYQDADAMKRVVRQLNPALDGFEASCFDGHYITGDIRVEDLDGSHRAVAPAASEGDEEGARMPLSLHGGAPT
ncbi:MAG TPA: amidophosphoribosyltransferase, partial [Rubrivivax sp.]|nr:amidophosphoribosyltransferase [Rubrivivax sp.]